MTFPPPHHDFPSSSPRPSLLLLIADCIFSLDAQDSLQGDLDVEYQRRLLATFGNGKGSEVRRGRRREGKGREGRKREGKGRGEGGCGMREGGVRWSRRGERGKRGGMKENCSSYVAQHVVSCV